MSTEQIGSPATVDASPAADKAAADKAAALPEIDGQLMRHVLGHFATGVVAITGLDPAEGSPTGLAANSFTSVSLDPPLIAFCVAATSTSWPKVRAGQRYTVNILADSQEEICRQLARRGPEKFDGISWEPSPSGAPVLEGCLAWMEAELESEYPAGDHTIVVSRLRHLHARELAPLVFFRGAYGRLSGDPEAAVTREVR